MHTSLDSLVGLNKWRQITVDITIQVRYRPYNGFFIVKFELGLLFFFYRKIFKSNDGNFIKDGNLGIFIEDPEGCLDGYEVNVRRSFKSFPDVPPDRSSPGVLMSDGGTPPRSMSLTSRWRTYNLFNPTLEGIGHVGRIPHYSPVFISQLAIDIPLLNWKEYIYWKGRS